MMSMGGVSLHLSALDTGGALEEDDWWVLFLLYRCANTKKTNTLNLLIDFKQIYAYLHTSANNNKYNNQYLS